MKCCPLQLTVSRLQLAHTLRKAPHTVQTHELRRLHPTARGFEILLLPENPYVTGWIEASVLLRSYSELVWTATLIDVASTRGRHQWRSRPPIQEVASSGPQGCSGWSWSDRFSVFQRVLSFVLRICVVHTALFWYLQHSCEAVLPYVCGAQQPPKLQQPQRVSRRYPMTSSTYYNKSAMV